MQSIFVYQKVWQFSYMIFKSTIRQVFLIQVLLLASLFTYGQSKDNLSFVHIDEHARKASSKVENGMSDLANYLAKPALNDFDKARSFYVWLTTNVTYDMQAYRNGRRRINKSNEDILKRKRAVCFGYSKFFKALCDEVGLDSQVISGYSKGSLTSTPKLEEPDHAWNAVKLEGKWYLLDATWGAGVVYRKSDFVHEFSDEYFLTSPEKLIVNHLPADPMWQLLPCAISTKDFKDSPNSLLKKVSDVPQNCIDYADSLVVFEQLDYHQKMLKTAINTHIFNPTQQNAKQLGHAYMDYEAYLDAKAIKLQESNSIEELMAIQQKMIQTSEQAKKYTALYDRQKENLAYTYMNLAATLSKKLPDFEANQDFYEMINIYEEILPYFEKAKDMLNDLPPSLFIESALEQCTTNIEAVKNNLDIYRKELKLND
ncbi:MAG: transglutaminase domain-containing protein [Chitinophagales bacterium]